MDKVAIAMRRKFSIIIQIITSIFTLFYIVFFILSFIPSPQGSALADHPYTPWDTEMITVKLLFINYMIGFCFSWKSRLISGLIYFLWCVLVVLQSVYISKLLNVSGDGIMFVPPVLIISIILIITGLIENKKINA